MAQNNTQGSLSTMIPQGTPAAPPQTPPSFGAKLLGNKEFSVELNDAVFETEAWKGSRYNGHQLEAVEINKFNKGDKTYAKTPVVEKYSRNIYIGNRVIGFDEDAISDNPNPGFLKKSYISLGGYFTINSDDTVTEITTNFENNNERLGFERSFREDFTLGSKASILLLDKGVEHNLKQNYTIDYNEGLLSRLLEISSSQEINPIGFSANSLDLTANGGPRFDGILMVIPNNLNLSTTESTLFRNNETKYYTDVSGSGTNFLLTNNSYSRIEDLLQKSITHYFEDSAVNKFFIEIKVPYVSGSLGNPYEFNTNSFGLTQVNTFEIDMNNIAFKPSSQRIDFRFKTYSANKALNILSNPNAEGISVTSYINGNPIVGTYTGHFGSSITSGPNNHFVFYKLNATPSILVNMIKEEDLPNSIGENGFIVIPENIDPKIKYNLTKILKDQLGVEIETGYAINGDVSPFDRNN